MELATTIRGNERARMERAVNFEDWTRQIKSLKEQIARRDAQRMDVTVLQQMHDLAASLPKGLLVRGMRTMGWTMTHVDVRDVVILVTSNALEREADAQAKRDRENAAAREIIAQLEGALAELIAEDTTISSTGAVTCQ